MSYDEKFSCSSEYAALQNASILLGLQMPVEAILRKLVSCRADPFSRKRRSNQFLELLWKLFKRTDDGLDPICYAVPSRAKRGSYRGKALRKVVRQL